MPLQIIGRADEKAILERVLQSNTPELVAVYGRRRIGKTYLIRNMYEGHIVFELTGLHNASTTEQLIHFNNTLYKFNRKKKPMPENWLYAFAQLEHYIQSIKSKRKKVIFFDEFPWLAGRKSGFLTAFTQFWNGFADKRQDVVVVICGSAASWMIQKVVNNRGGLHNRITQRLRLEPFSLCETEAFFRFRKIKLDRYQILKIYMITGGVPHYLQHIQNGQSADQNIERICFKKDSPLAKEYHNLFVSLFDKAERHEAVMQALAKKPKGLSRDELIRAVKLNSGGGASKILTELEESGFISFQQPYNKKFKTGIYRINDEYCFFYLKFIEEAMLTKNNWLALLKQQSYSSWCGFAFESICLKPCHVETIKKTLGISGISTQTTNWRIPGSTGTTGAQIDIVIDRSDGCINLCELKYSSTTFTITKAYAANLQNKIAAFRKISKTRKTVFLTFISTYGIDKNIYSNSMVDQDILMDSLFSA
jgi:uncharacterized protein